jgi:hypothetical protein
MLSILLLQNNLSPNDPKINISLYLRFPTRSYIFAIYICITCSQQGSGCSQVILYAIVTWISR